MIMNNGRAVSSGLQMATVAVLATACVTTREEGDLIRRDVSRLKVETRTAVDADAAAAERMAKVESRLSEMEQAQRATDDKSSRNRADFGAEVEALRQEVAGLRGALETKEYQLRERELQLGASQQQVKDLEKRLGELDKKVAELALPKTAPAAEAAKPPAIPSDRQGLYDYGKRAFDEKEFERCKDAFSRFQKQFPKDKELLDNAHFWLAECHFADKHYDKAILSYERVYKDFPSSNKADAALYKMGLAFLALGYEEDARAFFGELLQKFPKSALVKDAKGRLADLTAKKKAAAKSR
jgi:tol-pal system protein YbgF